MLLPFPLFGVGTIHHFIRVSSRLEDRNGSVLSRSVESVYTERRNENNYTPLSVIGYLLVRHVVVGVNFRARQGVVKKKRDYERSKCHWKFCLQKQSISSESRCFLLAWEKEEERNFGRSSTKKKMISLKQRQRSEAKKCGYLPVGVFLTRNCDLLARKCRIQKSLKQITYEMLFVELL